jgi:hypothetical protein
MTLRATATFKPASMAGLLAKVAAGLYAGVAEAAALVEGEAKTLCPVDTGALQASIDTVITRGVNAVTGSDAALAAGLFTVQAVISPHKSYAAYVEYGYGQRGAASAGAGPGPYGDRPGAVAQPFMRSSLDNNRENVIGIIQQAVGDAVRGGTLPLAA